MTDVTAAFDRDKIIRAMVGRSLSNELYNKRRGNAGRRAGKKVLSVQNLSMGNVVRNNSFTVYGGQITGIFGLIGSGRTETAKIMSGVYKRRFFHGGDILLDGRPVRYRVPRPAVRDGIVYVTEDRKIEGFFETMSIAENLYDRACWSPGSTACDRQHVRNARARRSLDQGAQHPRHQQQRPRDRAVGRQPAEGGHRQGAGAKAAS